MLPAVCGTFVAGGDVGDLPGLALATLFAWAMASHGLRSIGRVDADRVAGIVSTAVRLGAQGAAAVVLAAYVAAAGVATTMGAHGTLVGAALALYASSRSWCWPRPGTTRPPRGRRRAGRGGPSTG